MKTPEEIKLMILAFATTYERNSINQNAKKLNEIVKLILPTVQARSVVEPEVMPKIVEMIDKIFNERIEYFQNEQDCDNAEYVGDQLSREMLVKSLQQKIKEMISNFTA